MAKPLRRYLWLIETVSRAGNIPYDEIRRKWIRSAVNDLGETDYPKRTFLSHIREIQDLFGLSILCDRKNDYKYYMASGENRPGREELIASMSLSLRLLENQDLQKRVRISSFAFNNPHLPVLLDAIDGNKTVELSVARLAGVTDWELDASRKGQTQAGGAGPEPVRVVMQPYYLDFAFHTWFILGYVPERAEMEVFRIAKILSLTVLADHPFKRDDTLSFEDVRAAVSESGATGRWGPPRSIHDHRSEYYCNTEGSDGITLVSK